MIIVAFIRPFHEIHPAPRPPYPRPTHAHARPTHALPAPTLPTPTQAREHMELPEENAVGSIMTPRVQEDPRPREKQRSDPWQSTWRERLVLKDDVWKSEDNGDTWTLVTPGCVDPQEEMLPEWAMTQGDLSQPDRFKITDKNGYCRTNDDCFGAAECKAQLEITESCDASTESCICVCSMWAPRKLHRTVMHYDYLYMLGGFTYISHENVCGRMESARRVWKAEGDKMDPYACGGGYRLAMNDVWYSSMASDYPGESWVQLKTHDTDTDKWGGRGAHALAKMKIYGDAATAASLDGVNGTLALWIVGGEGGVPEATSDEQSYYQDIWWAPLPGPNDDPFTGAFLVNFKWERYNTSVIGWSPRGSHVVAVEPALPINNFQDRLCLNGGKNEEGILSDTWCWGAVCLHQHTDGESGYDEDNRCSKWKMASEWVKDYTADAWYRYQTKNLDDNCLIFSSGVAPDYCYKNIYGLTRRNVKGPPTPQQYYIDADSPLSRLEKIYLPGTMYSGKGTVDVTNGGSIHGHAPTRKPIVTTEELEMMASRGIHTIRDLATADRNTILKLRGVDFPETPEEDLMTFYDVCDVRELAVAAMAKCAVDPTLSYTDYQTALPQFLKEHWELPFDQQEGQEIDDIIENWNGCDEIVMIRETRHRDPENLQESGTEEGFAQIHAGEAMYAYKAREHYLKYSDGLGADTVVPEDIVTPNVPLIGPVPQVRSVRRPWRELQELHCKWNPGKRANHVGLFFDEKFFVLGGTDGPGTYRQDMWYRDDRLPSTMITRVPKHRTAEYKIRTVVDEDGTQQEYRMWDRAENLEVRRWNRFFNKIHVDWLDYWYSGGPGGEDECPFWERIKYPTTDGKDRCSRRTGKYTFYVRSVDPAGNPDPTYDTLRANMYRWDYVQPLPVHLIVGACVGAVLLAWGVYLEIRRRKRKAAMQRYAIKRMRRKFKATQKDAKDGKGGVDWKSMMDDDDGGGGKGKKKKKKKKDKDGGGTKNKMGKPGHKTSGGKKSKGGKDKDKDKKSSKQKDKVRLLD